jgi:hypothetical protein
MKIELVVFWVVTLEDGGSMFLRNVCILPHHYTVSQPRDCDLNLLNVRLLNNAISTAEFIASNEMER